MANREEACSESVADVEEHLVEAEVTAQEPPVAFQAGDERAEDGEDHLAAVGVPGEEEVDARLRGFRRGIGGVGDGEREASVGDVPRRGGRVVVIVPGVADNGEMKVLRDFMADVLADVDAGSPDALDGFGTVVISDAAEDAVLRAGGGGDASDGCEHFARGFTLAVLVIAAEEDEIPSAFGDEFFEFDDLLGPATEVEVRDEEDPESIVIRWEFRMKELECVDLVRG